MKNNFFCPLPFEQVSASTDGHYNVCCESFHNFDKITNKTPLEWFNSDPMIEIRDAFLSSNPLGNPLVNKTCAPCIRRSNLSLHNKRMREITEFKTRTKYEIDPNNIDPLALKNNLRNKKVMRTNIEKHLSGEELTQLASMHFSGFGNHCNLHCIMCSPTASSKWASSNTYKSHKGKDKKYWKDVEFIMKDEKDRKGFFDSVYSFLDKDEPLHITLTGGESLINPSDSAFIEHLSKNPFAKKNLSLFINTNGTVPAKIVKKLGIGNFKNVTLSISFDGMDRVYDYIRWGKPWETYNKNMKDLHKLADEIETLYLHTFTTVSALNVHLIPDMIKYSMDNNYFRWHKNWVTDEGDVKSKAGKNSYSKFKYHFLYNSFIHNRPENEGKADINLSNLPNHLKEEYLKKLQKVDVEGVNLERISEILENPEQTEDTTYKIRNYLDYFSKICKIDWKEIWPEFQ